jgi:hypothetical protein
MIDADGQATIEIVAEPSPWLLFARISWLPSSVFPTRISVDIDGALARLQWGEHAFRVVPGTHDIAVGVGMMFASKARLSVVVAANETVRVRYKPHVIKNVAGKLTIERLPIAQLVK